MKTLSLLKSLVNIESPCGREEKIAKYVLAYMRELGYDAFMDGLNVLLSPEKELIVATHLDTFRVLMPFSFDGEYAYGTGVCDAKAGITSILLALEKISRLNFGIALFYDEEGEGKGSEDFCKKYKPKRAIVIEPTNLTIANVQYGGLEANIKAKGIAAHGATPEKGENAIEKCIKIINELRNIEDAKVSVQYINGGSEDYVIPDECEMRVELSFKPEIKAENILRKVKEICSDNVDFIIKEIYDGFVSGDIVELLKRATEKAGVSVKFSEMPSWSDAVNLHLAGCDVVTFGPGELHLCHTSRERVKLEDVELTANILVTLNSLL